MNFELFNSNDIVQEKVLAIRQVYHNWGFILRRALKELTPTDRGTLRNAIQFRTEAPRNKKDITGTVKLFVGILDPSSPALRYLKYVVNGTKPHFVPLATKGGKYTGILGWMQRHNLVYYGRNDKGNGRSDWRWSEGINKGRLFNGIEVSEPGNDMFNKVYNRYYLQIQNDIQRILRGE